MTIHHPGAADDARLAQELAAEAGRRLLDLRGRHGTGGSAGAATLRDAGDRLAHEYITAELARRRPSDAVLSEEGRGARGRARSTDPGRMTADRVWIVDPLDGTREFGEPGRTDWAVHVALWERRPPAGRSGAGSGPEPGARAGGPAGRSGAGAGSGPEPRARAGAPAGDLAAGEKAGGEKAGGELTAGAVALPALGVTWSTLGPGRPTSVGPPGVPDRPTRLAGPGVPDGAPDGGRPTAGGGARKPFRIVVSRTRRPEIAETLTVRLGAELVPLGSAGAKVAAVLAGDADAYVHAGGFYEWDTAAPVAVARAAGFHASRLDGGPLLFNREDVWMPDILVCPSALARTLLDAIAAARSGDVPHDPAIG